MKENLLPKMFVSFLILSLILFLEPSDAGWAAGYVQEIIQPTFLCPIDEGPNCYRTGTSAELESHTLIEDITDLFGRSVILSIPRSDGWRLIRLCTPVNITGWVPRDNLHYLGRGYDCPDVDNLPNLSGSWKRQKYAETFKLYHSLIPIPKAAIMRRSSDGKPHTHIPFPINGKLYNDRDDNDL